jgi:photosystem II stability/assembly factor-like uncharacterized protein
MNMRRLAVLLMMASFVLTGLSCTAQASPATEVTPNSPTQTVSQAPGTTLAPTSIPTLLPSKTTAIAQPTQPVISTSTPVTTRIPKSAPSGTPSLVPPAQLKWLKTGGPIGGLGYDVRMRPDNPDRMYVTDAWSGVNISNDGGKTWLASNQGITSFGGLSGDAIPVFSLTISPQNPDIIWAGTQGIRGIFKSIDGGKTWQKKDQGVAENEGLSLRGFTVDPKNPEIVYAAGEISSFVWSGRQQNGTQAFDLVKGVVYKTTDGGEHWNAIWRGDNLARYVIIDPRDSNIIYVSTGLFDRDASNEDPKGGNLGGVGILKSTDGGKNWRVFNQANGLDNLYVGTLFMNPANPDVLLAGTGIAGPGGMGTKMGVYLSTDGGESWKWVLQNTMDAPISAVEYAQSNPNIAYAGGPAAIFRSSDMGRTWQKQTPGNFWGAPGTRAGFPIDFQVDPGNADRIFANNYGGGNFLSEDGGKTWVVASQGYTGAYLHWLVVNPQDRENVFVIGRTGPFRTSDAGNSWEGLTREPAVLGGEWYAVAIDPQNPDHIIISDEHQGVIFRSTDWGNSWSQVFRHPQVNVAVMEKRMGFKTIVFAPSNSQIVYAGMELERNQIDQNLAIQNNTPGLGVFESTDNGITWRDANDVNSANQNINMLAVHPKEPNTVYAATLKSGILKSTDGGKFWQPVNQGLNIPDVRSIAIDPNNPQTLFAGIENGGLYISNDGGGSWKNSSSGMDAQAAVHSIVFNPSNSQIVYAADIHSGVFRSDNGGKQWVRINNGLRTRAVTALAISKDGSLLYAATQGEGVFRLETAVYPE